MLVLTTCEEEAWVESVDAEPIARGAGGTPGEMAFSDAVIVIDPGHGGPNRGAVGPTGLVEADINVDIAGRVAALLESSQLLDGSDVPPAGRVILTRVPTSQGTDYEAGLAYRAELANRAGAHALVSIHNNADPDGPSDETGAEAWHRVMDHESRRLAGLMVEELRRAFAGFEADWAADTDAGAKARARDDGVTDYYGVLRNAGVPAVIVEGAYLSNPSEEALLREPAFRDAYASAVHAALVRFITTTDPGSGFTEAYPRTVPAGSGDPRPGCRVPEFSG
jgi:N-acetylmuramoyl-L-alanine amidase